MVSRRLVGIAAILVALTACSRDPEVAKQRFLEAGNKYFDRGKYKEASIIYRKAIQKDRRFGEAYYRLGLTELRLGRIQDALRSFRRACELQPKNQDAYAHLADLYLVIYLRDPRRSTAWLNELNELTALAEKHNPNSFDVLRIKAYTALSQNKLDDAISLFRQADKVKPFEIGVIQPLVQSLSAKKEYGEAEKLAKEAIAAKKSLLGIYDFLYLLYSQQNRGPEAEAILKLKCEKNPTQAAAWVQMAAHYYRMGKRAEMNGALEKLTGNPKDFPTAHKIVGDFYMRIREIDTAVAHYEDGIRATPANKTAYQNNIIEALAIQGKREEALRRVEKALEENRDDAVALALRGALRLQSGDRVQLQHAIDDFSAVLSRMPDNPVLRFNLGEAYLQQGDVEKALVQFQETLKLRPDYAPAKFSLARIHMVKGEHAKVVPLTDEILSADPANLPAKLIRSVALIGLGDHAQARRQLEEILKAYPSQKDAKFNLALLDYKEKNYKQAEQGFRDVWESPPRDARGLMGMVEVQVAQGKGAMAQKLVDEEIRKAPDNLDLRFMMASISARSGDYDRAIAELKYVLSVRGDDPTAHARLGESYYRAGKLGAAETHFRKAKEFRPNDLSSLLHLGMILESTGKTNEAKSFYEDVLKVSPDNPIALNNLAYLLAESSSDLDRALTLVQQARRRVPQDPNIADTLGWIYIKKNLSDSAIGIFNDLVTRDPKHVTWRYHLAMALYQKGDKPRARKELETALSHNPSPDEETKIRDLLSKTGS